MAQFALPKNSKVKEGILHKPKQPSVIPRKLIIYRWDPEKKETPFRKNTDGAYEAEIAKNPDPNAYTSFSKVTCFSGDIDAKNNVVTEDKPISNIPIAKTNWQFLRAMDISIAGLSDTENLRSEITFEIEQTGISDRDNITLLRFSKSEWYNRIQ